ncbi:MAG: carbohydrate kinase family protein [Bryobacteraceae bacterium]|nr:carbohydrate kinase family protein [Bryobacteraceae bacterium]
MIPGVLVCGNIVYDILVRPVDEIRYETSTWVEDISTFLGGNGSNTSYAIAKLGVTARLIGVVGQDPFGDAVLAILHEAGVDTRRVSRIPASTATTVGLVATDGKRAFLHRPGCSRESFANPIEFTPDLTAGCATFHLANIFAMPLLRRSGPECVRRARAAGLRTSSDTGWDARGEWMAVLGPCLPHLDILFTNEDEARQLTGAADHLAAAAALRAAGPKIVVIKRGPLGCSVFTPDSSFDSPALKVTAIDTTGAGDTFAGGFLAALHRGLSLEEAARVANAVGAMNVTRLGAVAGLGSWQETISRLP